MLLLTRKEYLCHHTASRTAAVTLYRRYRGVQYGVGLLYLLYLLWQQRTVSRVRHYEEFHSYFVFDL